MTHYESSAWHPLPWMVLLVTLAILFSFALACGMPFAALGALAALVLAPREAIFLGAMGWLANQVVGFGFLGYPLDAMTLAWGLALGFSALAAPFAAIVALRLTKSIGPTVRAPLAFLTAWAVQQGTVFAAGLVLGASEAAFSPEVLWFIFWTNGLAFAGLMAAQALGTRVGLARPSPSHSAG